MRPDVYGRRPYGQMLQTQLELQPGKSRVQLNPNTPQSQFAAHLANLTAQHVPGGSCCASVVVRPDRRTNAKVRVQSQ